MSLAAWATCEEPADHAAGGRRAAPAVTRSGRTPAFPRASLATQS